MEEEEFEKYFERIEEIYDIECLADDGIPAHLYNPEYREEKIKEILEEIIENNQTTWAMYYPKNIKRG
jgi:endoglucanase Acf2